MAIHPDTLAALPLFSQLDDAERRTLASSVEEVRVGAGEQLFERGAPGDSLYMVRGGAVELATIDSIGRRIVLERVEAGGFFGELSLLDGLPRSTDADVVEPLVALRVDRDDLLALFHKHPDASLELLAVMGRRLRESGLLLRYLPARNANQEVEGRATALERAADFLAAAAGSFTFLLLHAAWFAAWIGLNLGFLPGVAAFDPYPFGLLTMVVSLEAIFLSCFVLISQGRQGAKDRIRSDVEYEANIKAGLEVSQLHVKVDRLHEEMLGRIAGLDRRGV